MGFFSNYGKNVAEDARDGIISLLAKFDFNGASAAELDDMEDKLTDVSINLAATRKKWKEKKNIADLAAAKYAGLMNDVDKLQAAIDDPATPEATKTKAANLQADKVTELENLAPEAESARADEADIKEYVDMLEEAVRTTSANLIGARKGLEGKKQQLDKLKLKEEQNKDKLNTAKMLAGLKEQSSAIGKVGSVLDKDIEKAKLAADATKIKTDALMGTIKKAPVVDDDMAAILGTAKPAESVQDRLARLKKIV